MTLSSLSWTAAVSVQIREGMHRKSRLLSDIARNSNKPPPHPNLGNLVLFYRTSKQHFARMTEKSTDDDNDNSNDNKDGKHDQTSQELRMLSSVTLNCQVTKILMNSCSQLSEM